MAGGERPTIDPEDREHAAALVMDWSAHLPDGCRLTTLCQLELVGLVTAELGEARARERQRLADQRAAQ